MSAFFCGSKTSTRDKLVDNVIALLGHSNCVCQIDLKVTKLSCQKVLAAMEVSFLELTCLWPVVSKSASRPRFALGWFAPRLRLLHLDSISFQSTPRLITPSLRDIPPSGYIAPEAMVTCLSTSNVSKNFPSSPPTKPTPGCGEWRPILSLMEHVWWSLMTSSFGSHGHFDTERFVCIYCVEGQIGSPVLPP